MAQRLESGALNIQHGHTDHQVIVKFTRMTDHILLTPQQAEDFIVAVRGSMAQLAEHQKSGKRLA